MLTNDEASALTDADLESLLGILANEKERRAKAAAAREKAALSRKAKRDLRCPACHSPLRLDGRRADGIQRYRCPRCGRRLSDTSATSLAGSKLTPERIRSIAAMILLGSPDWVVAWICRADAKTAQYWRDRCLDAAVAWSGESKLSGHDWIDEMRLAPTRASGFVDGAWETYCLSAGCRGTPTWRSPSTRRAADSARLMASSGCLLGARSKDAWGGRVAEGSRLTHDGAQCHGPAIKKLSLGDDRVKYAPGDGEYKTRMGPMNSLCSCLRFSFEKHRGTKFAKLAAYGDVFMYQHFHARKYGLEATIGYLFSRVCGTEKSHGFRDGFKKTSTW